MTRSVNSVVISASPFNQSGNRGDIPFDLTRHVLGIQIGDHDDVAICLALSCLVEIPNQVRYVVKTVLET